MSKVSVGELSQINKKRTICNDKSKTLPSVVSTDANLFLVVIHTLETNYRSLVSRF